MHLTWSVTNISSVRLSIDPPTAAQGYTYFFDDYPAASGSADLPFACSPPNSDANGAYHLYVLTIKSGTFSTYRYVKVYA